MLVVFPFEHFLAIYCRGKFDALVKSRVLLGNEDKIDVGLDFLHAHFRVDFDGMCESQAKAERSNPFDSSFTLLKSQGLLLLTNLSSVPNSAQERHFDLCLLDNHGLSNRKHAPSHHFFCVKSTFTAKLRLIKSDGTVKISKIIFPLPQ